MNLTDNDVLAIVLTSATAFIAIASIAKLVIDRGVSLAEVALDKVRLQCRAENIKNAGWPPAHLDADGDVHRVEYDDNDVELLTAGVHPQGVRPVAEAS